MQKCHRCVKFVQHLDHLFFSLDVAQRINALLSERDKVCWRLESSKALSCSLCPSPNFLLRPSYAMTLFVFWSSKLSNEIPLLLTATHRICFIRNGPLSSKTLALVCLKRKWAVWEIMLLSGHMATWKGLRIYVKHNKLPQRNSWNLSLSTIIWSCGLVNITVGVQ